jgi:hypothetical protein
VKLISRPVQYIWYQTDLLWSSSFNSITGFPGNREGMEKFGNITVKNWQYNLKPVWILFLYILPYFASLSLLYFLFTCIIFISSLLQFFFLPSFIPSFPSNLFIPLLWCLLYLLNSYLLLFIPANLLLFLHSFPSFLSSFSLFLSVLFYGFPLSARRLVTYRGRSVWSDRLFMSIYESRFGVQFLVHRRC